MALNNLGVNHLTETQKQAIDAALNTIESNLLAVTQNLSVEERQKYGSVNETNGSVLKSV